MYFFSHSFFFSLFWEYNRNFVLTVLFLTILRRRRLKTTYSEVKAFPYQQYLITTTADFNYNIISTTVCQHHCRWHHVMRCTKSQQANSTGSRLNVHKMYGWNLLKFALESYTSACRDSYSQYPLYTYVCTRLCTAY